MASIVIVPYAIVFLAYITFVIFIILGGIFISNSVFQESMDNLRVVGIDTVDKRNIARMVMVLFWIVFLPLCFLPFYFIIKK